MSEFKVHTKETAPADSAALLATVEKGMGFVPNLLGVMAESPAVAKAYMTVGKIFDESSFSATERQVVLMTANRYNECEYCMAAHSVIAGMQKVPDDVIDAIRNDRPIADQRLEALRMFTLTAIERRGWLPDSDISAFLAAGFTQAQVFEAILGISFKTLSNFVNHIAGTPLDDAFVEQAWTAPQERLAG